MIESKAIAKDGSYQVRLPAFEGPMDLLLYLIKNRELEIEEVSISLITADFIAYVDQVKECGHRAIAEFLKMAATLLYIKSLNLLPGEDSGELDEDLEDPRKALVYQLIEYQKSKKMANFLAEKEGGIVFARKENKLLKTLKARFSYKEATFKEILDFYLKFFRPIKNNKLIVGKVQGVLSTVEDKVKWFLRVLKKKPIMSFFKLVKTQERPEKIVAFQATLEMGKQKQAFLHQEELFGDIRIENGAGTVDGEQEEIA